jgi:hypothetical protein
VALIAVISLGAITLDHSDYNTGAFLEKEQPVQFSHRHHRGDDGISCRYCHTSVEVSDRAGLPPTQTCMNCHSQIWADSRNGRPGEWRPPICRRTFPGGRMPSLHFGFPARFIWLLTGLHSHRMHLLVEFARRLIMLLDHGLRLGGVLAEFKGHAGLLLRF